MTSSNDHFQDTVILGMRCARSDVNFCARTTCISEIFMNVGKLDFALQDKQADVVIMLVRLGMPAGIFLDLAGKTVTIRFGQRLLDGQFSG